MSLQGGAPSALLTAQPVDATEKRIALAIALATVAAFAALAPFASVPMARAPLFLPIYQSALVTCDLVIAVFLFGRFAIGGSRALLVLGSAYLFSAAMAVFHALTFPGLFLETGWLGAGEQTTAWIYFLWHLGFPGAVIVSALMFDAPEIPRGAGLRGPGVEIGAAIIAAMALAVALVLVTTKGHAVLPPIMRGDEDLPAKYVVAWITWLVTLAALFALWRHGRTSVLGLWLMVVIVAWLCDLSQAAVFNSGRYSLGWYAGRSYGLLAATVLLAVLILEDARRYGQLIRTYAEERRQRRLVEQKTRDLDSLNASLERRVEDRTAELERANAELQKAQAEAHELAVLGATAREEERAHLARELHDDLNQALIILKNELASLHQRHLPDLEIDSMIVRMDQLVDRTLTAVKRIETNLRPAALDMFGLAAAVEWLADQFREHEKIDCELAIAPPDLELAEPCSSTLFRIVQEALANVAKHSRASRVEIALRREDDTVRLNIADNGIGFDIAAPRKTDSYGLAGLRERVHLVSGRISIQSAPGQGTRIAVVVPVA